MEKSRSGRLAIPAYSDIRSVGRRSAKTSPRGYLARDGFLMQLRSGDQVIAHRPRQGDLRISYFLKQKAAIPKRLILLRLCKEWYVTNSRWNLTML